MDWEAVVQRVDRDSAAAFVRAARHVIDALLIEADRVRRVQTPAERDYNQAELPHSTPAGGWLGPEELRAGARQLAEAIAAERWAEGFMVAVRLLRGAGGA